MKIKQGLHLSTGVVLLILIAAIVTVSLSARTHQTYSTLAARMNDMEIVISELRTLFSEQVILHRKRALGQMLDRYEHLNASLTNMRKLAPASDLVAIDTLESAIQSSRSVVEVLGRTQVSEQMTKRLTSQYYIRSTQVSQRMRDVKATWAQKMQASFERAAVVSLGFAILLALALFFLTFYLLRSVLRPVAKVEEAVNKLSAGDLTYRLPDFPMENELTDLGRTFNAMSDTLEHAITAMKEEVRIRRRMERRLAEQTTELTRSNEELEQFAYIASHDLQEPLRIIVSYLQLLERRYTELLDEDGRTYMENTIKGAYRMRDLIQSLLAYSRIGRRGQEFAPTDLNQVLEESLDALALSIEENDAVVEKDDLPTVDGDATQLRQLFQNLISNALKFRSDEQPRIRVAVAEKDDMWEVSVSDNGIGMEPRHAERIFVIFQRLHGRGKYPGTGIGLALCRRILDRHMGAIWVESEPGKGATFRFSLPKQGGHYDSSKTHSDFDG